MMKHLKFNRKFAELMFKAENVTERNEALILIKKVAKLKSECKNFDKFSFQN